VRRVVNGWVVRLVLRHTSLGSSRYDVSIFGRLAKLLETITKRASERFEHPQGKPGEITWAFEHYVGTITWTSYERSKFAIRCVDFWATCKIARNDDETASHGAVLCRAGGTNVFAAVCHGKRVRRALLSSYERSKFAKTAFDFQRASENEDRSVKKT